jgi:hypothetical protein
MATWNTSRALLSACTLSLLLGAAGCGGESYPASSISQAMEAQRLNATVDNHVTGSVGDGPIVGARLRVHSNSGQLLLETESSGSADYDINVKTKGRNYALTITADRGIDLVTGTPPDFRLVSTIVRPNSRTISNLNPYTTLIVGMAQKSGGISDSTVSAARDIVVSRYGFGLGNGLVADPTATPIDNSNVHVIVKTSETLGEMVRRTRDALNNGDGDAIVNALTSDLVDGWIDGQGARGSDRRVAAVANVASGAVLVQAMANRLHVYGNNATQAMDNAIRQIRPDAPLANNTANVQIPGSAFDQAVRGLNAAAVLVDDDRIAQAIEVMKSAVPGSKPADIAPRLPQGIDAVLDEAVRRAAIASDRQLDAILAAARDTGSSGNSGPALISGTPDTVLLVGSSWSFQPTVNDPNGPKLSFTVQGQPAWASFDTSTGRLAGTPMTAGAYGPVTITASDGSQHTSLAPFTLQVADYSYGSATVSWTPPTERTDGSTLTDLAGFKVYYGKDPASLTHIVNIKNAGQTSHYVENLDGGTWYFAVTAYCKGGEESAKSDLRSKTIQ